MAGFFAHLVLDRRSTSVFIFDRLKRIALPLALFGAVMAVSIPPIWVYGWYGVISLEVFRERQDLDSSGELVAHLWFLYYLLLMYAALIAFRLLGRLWRARTIVRPAGQLPLGMYLGNAVYTRMPMLLILGVVLLLVLRAGNESKPVWPLNVADLLYDTLFFFYGYGLYARRKLIDGLRESGTLAALWAMAAAVFFVHLVLIGAIDEASKQSVDEETIEFLRLIETVFYGASAVLLIGGLGRVHTKECVGGTLGAWRLQRLSTNALLPSSLFSVATSVCPTWKSSMPSCTWLSRAASGVGCRLALATGTPSTRG